MFDLVAGSILLFLSLSLAFLVWRYYREGKHSHAVLMIMLLGLALRLFMVSDLYLHKWDEVFHALVAKNMLEDPLKPVLYKNPVLDFDYRDWTHNHVWLHKQPFPMWGMALSIALFGEHAPAVRLPSVLLGLLGIWVIYLNRTPELPAGLLELTGVVILELEQAH